MTSLDKFTTRTRAVLYLLALAPLLAGLAFLCHCDLLTMVEMLSLGAVGMAVTVGQVITRKDGTRYSMPVAASVTLYEGTLAFINSSGYATSSTGTGANKFGGIVVSEQDNSSGSAGDLTVELLRTGQYLLTGTGFTQASVGADAFATDNFTITGAPSASGVRIGKIVAYHSTTQVWVELDVDFSQTSVVQTKTADYTVTVADSGRTFSTAGASGTVVFTLPAAVPGLKYRFRVGAAQELRIDPDGTETVSLPSTGVPGAAGKYLTANAAGETVDLECVVAGTWTVFGYTGTWTAEA